MCGPSTRRAASGKLAGLVQYNVGLISLHARVKIGGLGLIFLPPPSDMKSQSITRDGCSCLLLHLLGSNETSSKRETAVVCHAGGFVV